MTGNEFIEKSIIVLKQLDSQPGTKYLYGDKWELFKELRDEWEARDRANKEST